MAIGKCPICGGRMAPVPPDPDSPISNPDYECILCETQIWLPEKAKAIGKTFDECYFFLDHTPKEVLPSGPPKSKSGGNKSGKKYGNKKEKMRRRRRDFLET